jgi:hypothetical protein
MPIVGGMDIHRKQLTFDYADTETGRLERGRIAPADREHLAGWLRRFEGVDEVAFAVEGCTGWRYVAEEMRKAGVEAHLAEPADTAAARGRKRRAKTARMRSCFVSCWPATGSRSATSHPSRCWSIARCWSFTTRCAAVPPDPAGPARPPRTSRRCASHPRSNAVRSSSRLTKTRTASRSTRFVRNSARRSFSDNRAPTRPEQDVTGMLRGTHTRTPRRSESPTVHPRGSRPPRGRQSAGA